MIDRTTKVLLGIIAAALWLHLFSPLWEPAVAQAQGKRYLREIARDVGQIHNGLCLNTKIC